MTLKIILIVLCVGLIGLGIYLVSKNISGIKTANKGIAECQEAYDNTGNPAFLRLLENWKTLRGNDYAMLPVNSLIIIINIFTIARIVAQLV